MVKTASTGKSTWIKSFFHSIAHWLEIYLTLHWNETLAHNIYTITSLPLLPVEVWIQRENPFKIFLLFFRQKKREEEEEKREEEEREKERCPRFIFPPDSFFRDVTTGFFFLNGNLVISSRCIALPMVLTLSVFYSSTRPVSHLYLFVHGFIFFALRGSYSIFRPFTPCIDSFAYLKFV